MLAHCPHSVEFIDDCQGWVLCSGTYTFADNVQAVWQLWTHPERQYVVQQLAFLTGTSRLSLLQLKYTAAQVDAYGGEDDRPSGYQPRNLGMGMASGSTSYSSPQLTAAHDGSEEVRCCICRWAAICLHRAMALGEVH